MEGHEHYAELISQRIDGILEEDGQRELSEHIAACPECRELSDIMDGVHGALDFEMEPPAELLANVMESVRRENAARNRIRRRWIGFAGAFAAAAAVLALVILPGGLQEAAQYGNSPENARHGEMNEYSLPGGADEDNGQTPAVCIVPPESGITAFSLTDMDFDEFAAGCYAVVYFDRFPEDVEPGEPITFTNGAAGRYMTVELLEKYESTADRVDYHDPESGIIIAVVTAE